MGLRASGFFGFREMQPDDGIDTSYYTDEVHACALSSHPFLSADLL